MEQEPSKSWTSSAFDRVNNEWVHTTNYSYDHTKELDLNLLVRQAPAMRITPSKRKTPETDYLERVACIGDIHFPFQNDKRLALAETALRATEPSIIALMGDNLDNTNYSRFGTRAEWGDSTQKGIDQYAEFLGRLRANHPESEIVWIEGNHDQRLEKRIREYNEDVLGIRRAGEESSALSLDFLLRLEELGVRFEAGYPSARVTVQDQLELYHGHVTTSRGLAASKVIEHAFRSFTTGHTHQLGLVSKTFYVGDEERTIYGAEAGTYADPDLTPSGKYAPNRVARHNWQTGIIDWIIDEESARPSIFPIDNTGVNIYERRYRS